MTVRAMTRHFRGSLRLRWLLTRSGGPPWHSGWEQASEVAELSAVGDMGKGSYSNLFSSRVKLAFFVLFL